MGGFRNPPGVAYVGPRGSFSLTSVVATSTSRTSTQGGYARLLTACVLACQLVLLCPPAPVLTTPRIERAGTRRTPATPRVYFVALYVMPGGQKVGERPRRPRGTRRWVRTGMASRVHGSYDPWQNGCGARHTCPCREGHCWGVPALRGVPAPHVAGDWHAGNTPRCDRRRAARGRSECGSTGHRSRARSGWRWRPRCGRAGRSVAWSDVARSR